MKLSALIMSLALVGFVAQANEDHAAPAAAPAPEVTAPAADAPAADAGHHAKKHDKKMKKHGKKGEKGDEK